MDKFIQIFLPSLDNKDLNYKYKLLEGCYLQPSSFPGLLTFTHGRRKKRPGVEVDLQQVSENAQLKNEKRREKMEVKYEEQCSQKPNWIR